MPTFTGAVQDLDFIAELGWCQVILTRELDQLVATTDDVRMQALLELAFATGARAEVGYTEARPNVLTRVKVNRDTIPPR